MPADEYAEKMTKYYGPAWMGLDEVEEEEPKEELWRVVLTSWGGLRKTYMNGLTWEDAVAICEDNDWVMDLGYIWDLEIEEDW